MRNDKTSCHKQNCNNGNGMYYMRAVTANHLHGRQTVNGVARNQNFDETFNLFFLHNTFYVLLCFGRFVQFLRKFTIHNWHTYGQPFARFQLWCEREQFTVFW